MIILKHVKIDDISFVAQKDMLKTLQRSLRRANIQVHFSQGFVPHMITYTSPPLPLGVQSLAEYFVVDCSETNARQVLEVFNKSCPEGLKATKAWFMTKNPNISAKAVAARFNVKLASDQLLPLDEIMQADSFEISINKKDGIITKDVRSLIFDVKQNGNKLELVLGAGNNNLRVDAFVSSLINRYGVQARINEIEKTQLLAKDSMGFIDIEETFGDERNSY